MKKIIRQRLPSAILVGILILGLRQTCCSQLKIESGGILICTGNLQNAGTITNDGRIQVQGNFLNTGTYNSTTADDSLTMFGIGNSDLKGGASTLNYLQINKSSPEEVVKLTGSTLLAKKLIFDEGTFTTDPINNFSYVLSAPVSAIFSFATGKEIIGRVTRTGWVNGSTIIFNQPNMQVSTAGGSAPSDLTITMIPQAGNGDPSQNERELKRKFLFNKTGGSGFTADVRFPYIDPELNTNTETNLAAWILISSEWNRSSGTQSVDNSLNYLSLSGISSSDFVNEWKLADSKYSFNLVAYLRGSWNGTNMNVLLNSTGLLNGSALTQPFNSAPFNYAGSESVSSGFFTSHPNIVDWILVECRKPSSGLPADALSSTRIGRKAGFILNNGAIVDLDGITPISFDINKQGGGFITIRHRNHLAVMSNFITSNASGSFANNFSILANNYKNPAISSNPLVLLSGSIYGLWAGDADKNGILDNADLSTVKLATANGLIGYQFSDVNMSGNTGVADLNLIKLMITAGGQGSSPARPQGPNKSHVPGD